MWSYSGVVSMNIYLSGGTMSEQETRELVRERYAAAARAVASGGGNSEALEAEHCCPSPSSAPVLHVEVASSCCGETVQVRESFGSVLYDTEQQGELPVKAVAASLGCGNPTAVAELRRGERVLDLGSGGGIDVLLSARRVGEEGFAYGVDMTDEMLDLA